MIRILPKRDLSSEVWKLAGPVVVGMISQTLLNVVDTAMVGRLGAVALGAAGLGGVLAWMVLGSCGALNVGTQAVAARRFGEERFKAAGQVLDNSLALAVVIGGVITLFFAPGMREIFSLFSNDPAVIAEGRGYIFYRLLGGLPLMLIMAHRGFFNGIGKTQLHMRVAIVINTTNILLNYMFIFGNFGAPRMETPGAGLASALATTIGSLYFLSIGVKSRWKNKFDIYNMENLDKAVAWNIMRLTIPSGIQALLAMLGFSVFTALVARIGTVELAATNVCITVMSLAFLPGFGVGLAGASLVGQKLGAGKPDEAEIYGWESGRLGMILMGLIGISFIVIPSLIISIFTDDPAVIKAGIIPLRMMGLVQIFDALGMVFSQALQGAGLNRWVMIVEVGVNWGLFIPGTILLAFVLDWGLVGAWIALGVYLVVFGIIVTVKFASGSWKTSKV